MLTVSSSPFLLFLSHCIQYSYSVDVRISVLYSVLDLGGELHRLVAFEQVAAVVEVAAALVWVSIALIDVASEKAWEYCLFWWPFWVQAYARTHAVAGVLLAIHYHRTLRPLGQDARSVAITLLLLIYILDTGLIETAYNSALIKDEFLIVEGLLVEEALNVGGLVKLSFCSCQRCHWSLVAEEISWHRTVAIVILARYVILDACALIAIRQFWRHWGLQHVHGVPI